MTLIGFLTRQFLLFLLSINLFLASLFTVVEFFEKFLRVKHTDSQTILYFLGLNFVPSFFDLLPVSMWLATLLLLRELTQSAEWEFLQLLTFIPRSFFRWLLVSAFSVAAVCFVVRETVGVSLSFKAEQFRQEKFKQNEQSVLVHQWLELDQNTFCYMSFLDLKALRGNDLLFVTMTPDFSIKTLFTAPEFFLDASHTTITIGSGMLYDMQEQENKVVVDYALQAPSFFSQLRLHGQAPTLVHALKTVILSRHILPESFVRDLVRRCLVRLGYYLQLCLYPILTFCLFMFFVASRMRWLAALAPYPYFVLAGFIVEGLASGGTGVWVLVIPYVLAGLLIIALYLSLLRHRSFKLQ